jgi:hypothetical protein
MKCERIEYNSVDVYGAHQTARHAGSAFTSGHPGIAAAHLAYRFATMAVKEIRKLRPFKCTACGRRSG